MTLPEILISLLNVTLVPPLLLGTIRRLKARMQGRRGAPVLQPFYDLAKLLRKGETISETTSALFVWSPRLQLAITLVVAVLVPWSGAPPLGGASGAADFLLVLYLLALAKFVAMLSALDAGSAFGGLGASREATLSVLVEPILVVGLGAMALSAGSTDLARVYGAPTSPFVAGLVGAAFVVAGLVELSRMPVDDPTTHLELTMVHEALILENSGRNLALIELSVGLRTCVFLGLAVQTLLAVSAAYGDATLLIRYGTGLLLVFAAGGLLAVAEGMLVKLNWRRVPNFIAFGMALTFLGALVAAAHR